MAIVEKVDGFFIPNVTLIGVGAAKAIPERIVYLNATKPLLVTDKGIVHTGILKQITDILDEAAMEYAIYDETVPNPTDLNVARRRRTVQERRMRQPHLHRRRFFP